MPTIQFSHANGFSASTYRTFLNYFENDFQVYAVEKFGHSNDYPVDTNWFPMVDQLIDHIEQYAQEPVIGVGHSLGGILTFLAAQRRPRLFQQIIVMDPPMFSSFKRTVIGMSQRLNIAHKTIPPAKKTLRRRRYFETKEEAYHYLKPKRLFKNFDERCFKDFITYGITSEKDAFTLDFSVDLEYKIFLTIPTKFTWKVEVPMHFLYSGKHEVLDLNDIKELQRKLKRAEFLACQEGGHMFPLEDPERISQLIKEIAL